MGNTIKNCIKCFSLSLIFRCLYKLKWHSVIVYDTIIYCFHKNALYSRRVLHMLNLMCISPPPPKKKYMRNQYFVIQFVSLNNIKKIEQNSEAEIKYLKTNFCISFIFYFDYGHL